MYKLPYFHGEITKEKAISATKNKQPGSFLVRNSQTSRSNFTITYVNNDGEVRHTHINHPPLSHKYWINGTTDIFNSIDKCISIGGKSNGLFFPVENDGGTTIDSDYVNIDLNYTGKIGKIFFFLFY